MRATLGAGACGRQSIIDERTTTIPAAHPVVSRAARCGYRKEGPSMMSKGRLEAFSDGVIAIIITIMVLELRTPHGTDLASLAPLWPKFASYAVSFAFLAIYWNNHHHMLQATRHVDGRILWANMHLLFWLSLFPFATAWTGESHFAPVPVAAYGVVQMFAGCAYYVLSRLLIRRHGEDSA